MYDDEADASLMPGKPAPEPDAPPMDLMIEQVDSVIDADGKVLASRTAQGNILNGFVTALGFDEACFEFCTAGGIVGTAVVLSSVSVAVARSE